MDNEFSKDGPLGYQGPLVHEDTIPVLGIPVYFRTNNQTVIKQADSALGHWKTLPDELRDPDSDLKVEIIVGNIHDDPVPPQYDFFYRFRDDIFLASQGRNLLSADRRNGKALAFVTPDLVSNTIAFNWSVLEGLVIFLLTKSRRVPIHASAVTRENQAFAFIGNTGAGKSTLAYACLKRGFNLLSEDAIYVGTESDYRIWGNATTINLLPDSVKLFPELSRLKPSLRPNGKLKISVSPAEIKNCEAVLQVPEISVFLIDRNHDSRESSLNPVSSGYVVDSVLSSLEPGFSIHEKQIPDALERLLTRDAYHLKIGHDLDGTIDLLMNLT